LSDAATLRRLRETILRTSAAAKEGHISSAFSILEIVWTLYDRVMMLRDDDRDDRFVLSKGHSVLALYAVLAEKGYFSPELLATFCQPGSKLYGHPDHTVPGVEVSTGSLGHGITVAVGMAKALKMKGSPARVFCIVGDGELNEGSCWEAALIAAHHKLDNLTVIVDWNRSGERALRMDSIGAKFDAFGWVTNECSGHSVVDLESVLRLHVSNRPVCIVAHTTKGAGCAPMENDPSWHHRYPRPDELESLLSSL